MTADFPEGAWHLLWWYVVGVLPSTHFNNAVTVPLERVRTASAMRRRPPGPWLLLSLLAAVTASGEAT